MILVLAFAVHHCIWEMEQGFRSQVFRPHRNWIGHWSLQVCSSPTPAEDTKEWDSFYSCVPLKAELWVQLVWCHWWSFYNIHSHFLHRVPITASWNLQTTSRETACILFEIQNSVNSYSLLFLVQDSNDNARKQDGKVITHLRSKLIINALDYKEPLPRKNLPIDISQVLR